MSGKSQTQHPRENKQQVAAFRKAARELGCESDEKQFQDALRTIAKAKPSEKKSEKP
jgi:isopentenyldiphosphate isomerase